MERNVQRHNPDPDPEPRTAGEFHTLRRGKLRKGKVVETTTGDEVCRMAFRVRSRGAPAADSVVYLKVKGLTFDVSWPAADVADGRSRHLAL